MSDDKLAASTHPENVSKKDETIDMLRAEVERLTNRCRSDAGSLKALKERYKLACNKINKDRETIASFIAKLAVATEALRTIAEFDLRRYDYNPTFKHMTVASAAIMHLRGK